MGLKFQNTSFNTLSKLAFWNKEKWFNQDYVEQVVHVKRQPIWWDSLEKDQFHLQEHFW